MESHVDIPTGLYLAVGEYLKDVGVADFATILKYFPGRSRFWIYRNLAVLRYKRFVVREWANGQHYYRWLKQR